jgi:hypothetical protein
MNRTLLNEHDANQGAQSRGEFLGMTGNSGWYLLGSVAASLLIVILCWGMFGISLLLCLLVGVVLCGLSVAYVFALKNNRPDHYDTDFFESALIEAGVMEMAFGPRHRRIASPFSLVVEASGVEKRQAPERRTAAAQKRIASSGIRSAERPRPEAPAMNSATDRKVCRVCEPVVPLASYEHLREELDSAEEMLEDALTERAED